MQALRARLVATGVDKGFKSKEVVVSVILLLLNHPTHSG